MPDDLLSSPIPLPPRRAGVSSRGLLLAMLLAFAGGTVLAGWLIWDGRVSMADLGLRQPAAPAPRATLRGIENAALRAALQPGAPTPAATRREQARALGVSPRTLSGQAWSR